VTEIEVTDPTHALFGRRFPLLSLSSPPIRTEHVLVGFRGHMALRIPVNATNLAPARPCSRSKLTLAAITELISLAEQCEVLCPSNRERSGAACHQDSAARSLPTSPLSSKR
jgi:F420-0:gamma-glutamyl ligase-like protein